ncbi:restriction endonuclease subunit S [Lysinibacillus sphaericus]|uniref:Restriction endonuclease subunit S n=1 Tax=Lysinibacillus sphaericus TaxID=1421 RepID=A0A544UGC7_LYSSH|nr:restriction endonuclease subunit S [Lysinibacillus sp. SDF0037]TQR31714.1 restriction endonuclease subunit S [Lysinibacillus sp. SDF0037]
MPTYKLIELIDDVISGEWGQDVEDETNGIKVIRTTNFSNTGKLDLDKEVVFRNIDKAKVAKKKLQLGDIIIEKSGGSPDQPVGRVVYFEEDELYLCNNFTSVLRPKKELVVPKFLLYVLFNLHRTRKVLKFQNKTTGIINLKLEQYLNQIDVIIPSLEIQKKIVLTLDQAYALIEKRQSQITALDELTQSLFLEMFGNPIQNSLEWKVQKLEEVVEKDSSISYGIVQTGQEIDGGIPVIRPVDFNDEIDVGKLKKTSVEISNAYSRTILKGNELLITVRANIGSVILATSEMEGINVTRGITPIKFNGKIIDRRYAMYLFKNINMQRYLKELSKGITLIQLNMSDLRKVPIILPPIEMQLDFALKIDLIQKQRKMLKKSLVETDELYNSLLQKAFKGELFQKQ